tara:strand:+ start:8361 stop:8639 length:279 start_codon:yes stop_codon:yes gene_type:complete
MNIQHEESETKGAFFIESNSTRIAEITYSKAGSSRIIIDHTGVSDEHRNEGLGKKLVFHVAEFAEQYNLKVLPLCPYAKSVFSRYPELQKLT